MFIKPHELFICHSVSKLCLCVNCSVSRLGRPAWILLLFMLVVGSLFSETNAFSIFQCISFSLDSANGVIVYCILGLFYLSQCSLCDFRIGLLWKWKSYHLRFISSLCGQREQKPRGDQLSCSSADLKAFHSFVHPILQLIAALWWYPFTVPWVFFSLSILLTIFINVFILVLEYACLCVQFQQVWLKP